MIRISWMPVWKKVDSGLRKHHFYWMKTFKMTRLFGLDHTAPWCRCSPVHAHEPSTTFTCRSRAALNWSPARRENGPSGGSDGIDLPVPLVHTSFSPEGLLKWFFTPNLSFEHQTLSCSLLILFRSAVHLVFRNIFNCCGWICLRLGKNELRSDFFHTFVTD